jgi:hypothetical protein
MVWMSYCKDVGLILAEEFGVENCIILSLQKAVFLSHCKKRLNRMKARLSTDLGDPKLLKLLKAEAAEKDSSIKDVLVDALESYFAHRIENKALQRATEKAFDDWHDPRDSEYDKL